MVRCPVLVREMQLQCRANKMLCNVMDRSDAFNVTCFLEILGSFLVYWYETKEKKINPSIAESFLTKKNESFCHICYF